MSQDVKDAIVVLRERFAIAFNAWKSPEEEHEALIDLRHAVRDLLTAYDTGEVRVEIGTCDVCGARMDKDVTYGGPNRWAGWNIRVPGKGLYCRACYNAGKVA